MFLLRPFSLLYGLGVSLRNILYDRNIMKIKKLPVPVISVGNLSSGGTGKTSLVRFLASELGDRLRVAVLLRGYKRKSKGILVVSEWGRVITDVVRAGDEAFLLGKLLPRASVIVCEDRFGGGMVAVRELGADMLILDDGFQHRRLHRDLDIVLLRRRDLSDRLLPEGLLREPLSSLKRAHTIVLSYQETEPFDFEFEGKPVFRMFRKFGDLLNSSFESVPVEELKNKELVAFAGLGSNEQFFKMLKREGFKIKKEVSLPDHYPYTDFGLESTETYITTLKDMVKLPSADNLFALDIRLEVKGLVEFVKKTLQL